MILQLKVNKHDSDMVEVWNYFGGQDVLMAICHIDTLWHDVETEITDRLRNRGYCRVDISPAHKIGDK